MPTLVDSNTILPAAQRAAWKALETHYQTLRHVHLRDLFADELPGDLRMSSEEVPCALGLQPITVASRSSRS